MISTETAKNGPYVTDGGTTIFNYTFRVDAADELEVIQTDDTSLAEVVLTLTTDYSVTGVGVEAGGTIVTTAIWASGSTLTIRRAAPFTQETDIANQSTYYPDVLEAALDKNVQKMQQLKEVTDRALVGNATDTAIDAGTKRLINVVDPVNGQDAVTKAWAAANLAVDDTVVGASKSSQTATVGQTIFTVPAYVPGSNTLVVVINGVWQMAGAFVETSTTLVTMCEGLEEGDDIEFRLLSLAAQIRKVLFIVDEKAQGTDGGTFTALGWRTRDLTTVQANDITGASLATNAITLPVGTYLIEASAPAYEVVEHQCRLYATSGDSIEIYGTSEFADATGAKTNRSFLPKSKLILTQTTVLELQHHCSITKSTTGFGPARNSAGHPEIYSYINIEQIG